MQLKKAALPAVSSRWPDTAAGRSAAFREEGISPSPRTLVACASQLCKP